MRIVFDLSDGEVLSLRNFLRKAPKLRELSMQLEPQIAAHLVPELDEAIRVLEEALVEPEPDGPDIVDWNGGEFYK